MAAILHVTKRQPVYRTAYGRLFGAALAASKVFNLLVLAMPGAGLAH